MILTEVSNYDVWTTKGNKKWLCFTIKPHVFLFKSTVKWVL